MRTSMFPAAAQRWWPAVALVAGIGAATAAEAPRGERSGKQVVDAVCAACHGAAPVEQASRSDAAVFASAPKIGNRAAWIPHLSKGLDALVVSAVHGHGLMPARGGMAELSDREIREAIVYMFNHGLPATTPPAAAVPADPRHKLVAGTDVYFGALPAAAVGTTSPEMPKGKGYYHLNISLADHETRTPVTDAQVRLRISDGTRSQTKDLGVVAANRAVSYGNWFRFDAGSAYAVTAEIRRPGVPFTFEARFDFKAP